MKNNLKAIRLEKNVTQEKLARIVDISLRQVQNIESGKSSPNVYLAIKIKKALKVENIEDIFYEY